MKKFFVFLCMALTLSTAVTNAKRKESPVFVKIETNYGNLKVKLYDETPMHRDNFVKLVESKFYDGLLFHRVINQFMIQGGDPESKNAPTEKSLGTGSLGYTIPAEIIFPKFYHKHGALAAARTVDAVNPQRESSGSQFYIVQGAILSDEELDEIEEQLTQIQKQITFRQLINKNRSEIDSLMAQGKKQEASELKEETYKEAVDKAEKIAAFHYSDSQRQTYKTFGGTPHLDCQYTVFGELVDGFNILEAISNVETGKGNRPKNDVIILKMRITKK